MVLKVFGIRHHGPGSAKSLKKALNQFAPDCIIIECPADAESMIPYIANPGLKPPISLLIYNPKLLTQAAYIPFVDFSPEWQSLKYAVKNEVEVRFMDLPMNLSFAVDQMEKKALQLRFDHDLVLSEEEKSFRKDPLSHMAEIAGYKDSERWWEITFESIENEIEIFDAILEMMTALRADTLRKEEPRTLLREAYMRKVIRKAIKDGFQNIAVVCGAWHAPVLQNISRFKQSADNAVLRGIKKINTKVTWVPWSYDRLTYTSGYGAGVNSPAWYELLFSNRKEVLMRWMVKAARLFRKEDLDTSSAHVIEAVRLADTLATLRNLSIPGIEEMKAAAISTFCEGDEQQLKLIEQQLIVGKKVGNVPPEIPSIPLQQDIEKTVKTARLSNYWKNTDELWLKATASNPRGGIDLREAKDLLKSHLLHRMLLLGIPWGKQMKEGRFDTGSFKEYWKLKWRAEFSIKIIEAGMWGNTVHEASSNFVLNKIQTIETLPELTQLTEKVLNAQLGEVIAPLLQQLQNLAALTNDVYHLMDALPNLINIIRYGNTRKTDLESVEQVVQQIIPRICIALPGACLSLDEDAADNLFEKIMATNRALSILNNPVYNNNWYQALENIAQLSTVDGKLNGVATRLLFDKGIFSTSQTATQMSYSLSQGNEPMNAALWIEGFLYGSGLLLLHKAELWNILNNWVEELPWLTFKKVLPLLRRTFSNFPAPEREKMMNLARQGVLPVGFEGMETGFDEERAKEVLPIVQLLLGID